jgi:hypothetical protein
MKEQKLDDQAHVLFAYKSGLIGTALITRCGPMRAEKFTIYC